MSRESHALANRDVIKRNNASVSWPLILGLAFASAATTWLAFWSWRGFTTQSPLFLGPLFFLAILIAALGAGLRIVRAPGLLILVIQSAVGFVGAQSLITGSALPTPAVLADLVARISAALTSAQEFASPVPREAAGVEPLLILGGVACLVLTDTLAGTLRRVPLAGLPLLTIYTIPVSLTGAGASWWVFVGMAAGFVLMLFLAETEHVARWGRTLGMDGDDPAAFGVRTGAARGSAAAITALATAAALVVPLALPSFSLQLFSGGFGTGGGGDLRIENPMTDLRRDLNRGADIRLLKITTDDPDPRYLRIAVLNRLGDNEWSSGDRTVPTENLAQGMMPPPTAVAADVPSQRYDYQVEADEEFESLWLPTSQNVEQILAPGNWRYDTTTMDFLSGGEDLTTSGLDYEFTKLSLDLSGRAMARTRARGFSEVSSEFTRLPEDLSPVVGELTNQVGGDSPSQFQRAVALQNWFRTTGGFTYSLDTPIGNGAQDLESFLTQGRDGRTGYCEQFASAMAVMARSLDIPSRVAVGFLAPEQTGPNQWEYSAHDMHAWPELYFPGAGWVRFEPTPAAGPDEIATSAPTYTTERLPDAVEPTAVPSQAEPSADLPQRGPDVVEPDVQGDEVATDSTSRVWLVRALGGIVLVALLVGLAMTPSLLRRVRRDRRWRDGADATAAWDELRDTAADLGITWRQGLSPRATAADLAANFGAPASDGSTDATAEAGQRPARGAALAPLAAAALDRIVAELELLRYSQHRPAPDVPGLRLDTETCAAALVDGSTSTARRRARWLPRSLWRRRSRTRVAPDPEGPESPATDSAASSAGSSGVVDHVG